MSEETVLTPNAEPLFKIAVKEFAWINLTMAQLEDKLKLMRKLGLTRYFHITEQEGKWVPKPKEEPKKHDHNDVP